MVKTDGGEVVEPIHDITTEACALVLAGEPATPGSNDATRAALAAALVAKDSDADGQLRLIAVEPEKTTIGRHICLVVAGVVPRSVVVAARENIRKKQASLDDLQKRLADADAATPPKTSEAIQLRQKVDEAEAALDKAREDAAKQRPVVDLTVYFNDDKSPITVKAQSTDAVQRLIVPLDAPASATDDNAEYWRALVRNVANAGQPTFGEVELTVGMSRTASAGDIPETGASGEPQPPLTLYVYSPPPIKLGLAAFGCLALALCFYAYGSPLLRDNSLTRRMLPSELAAAKLMLAVAEAAEAEANKQLEQAKTAGGPVDGKWSDAVVAASAAVNHARIRLERVVQALGINSTAYTGAQEQLDKTTAALEKAGIKDALLVQRNTADQERAAAAGALSAFVLQAATAWRTAAETALNADSANATLQRADQQARADAQAFENAVTELIGARTVRETARAALEAADAASRGLAERDLADKERDLSLAMTKIDSLAAKTNSDRMLLQQQIDTLSAKAKAAQDAQTALANFTAAETARDQAKQGLDALEDPTRTRDDKAIGAFSLGRTQMAFWLFLVVAAYVYIAMSIGQIYGLLSKEVVYLLGISTLTAAGAMVLSSTSNETRISRNFFADILTADDTVQLQRVAAVMWTLVLAGVFVFVVASTFTMPVFDPMQLLLMGLVNGVYVGLKLPEAR